MRIRQWETWPCCPTGIEADSKGHANVDPHHGPVRGAVREDVIVKGVDEALLPANARGCSRRVERREAGGAARDGRPCPSCSPSFCDSRIAVQGRPCLQPSTPSHRQKTAVPVEGQAPVVSGVLKLPRCGKFVPSLQYRHHPRQAVSPSEYRPARCYATTSAVRRSLVWSSISCQTSLGNMGKWYRQVLEAKGWVEWATTSTGLLCLPTAKCWGDVNWRVLCRFIYPWHCLHWRVRLARFRSRNSADWPVPM